MFKILFFDLDNTLIFPNNKVSDNIWYYFAKLTYHYKVSIISGASFDYIYNNFLKYLKWDINFDNLYIQPSLWLSLYKNNNWKWIKTFEKDKLFKLEEKEYIKELIEKEFSFKVKWNIFSDKWEVLSYHVLWKDIQYDIAFNFDKNKRKRQSIINNLLRKVNGYSFWIWGFISIDITKKWFDKKFWVKYLLNQLKLKKDEVLYIWDSFFCYGNDSPVLELWIYVINVESPKKTLLIIKKLTKYNFLL
jgi:hydroxymethylpyrimidine pyrophosphatase-like HAD family hydrolase